MKFPYRYDIEGLRALAILAVVAFHINPAKLPGGYIGVDMFFVISGFLITNHILGELSTGTFRFRDFYLKRVRRLYPALFAMLIATSIAVYAIYLPADMKDYGSSLISSTFYASNIFFYTKSDYFNPELENAPLLHTWSLSVEEQFYLFFPLLVFFFYKWRKGAVFPVIAIGSIISFVASEWLLRSDAAAAFFLSPTRFWQFMAGGALAYIGAPHKFPRLALEGGIIVGLALLGYSVFFLSGQTPFPGFYALLPTIGTALIIYAGTRPNLLMSRLMSIKPALFFGRISYSLYLWHWPIIAIYRYRFAAEFSPIGQIMLFAASILLGTLSFYYIEKPTRRLPLDAPLFYKALGVSIAAACAGLFLITTDLTARYNNDTAKISTYLDYGSKPHNRLGTCFLTSGSRSSTEFNRGECLALSKTKPNILLLGDSHGAHFYEALRDAYPNANVMQATASGCKPVLHPVGEERCTGVVSYVLDEFLPAHRLDMIFVSARWLDEDVDAAVKTAQYLKKYAKHVVISGPIPEYPVPLPRLIIFGEGTDNPAGYTDRYASRKKSAAIDAAFREKLPKDVTYFSTLDAMCGTGECRTLAAPGIPMQWDYGHLTYEGAKLIVIDLTKTVRP